MPAPNIDHGGMFRDQPPGLRAQVSNDQRLRSDPHFRDLEGPGHVARHRRDRGRGPDVRAARTRRFTMLKTKRDCFEDEKWPEARTPDEDRRLTLIEEIG